MNAPTSHPHHAEGFCTLATCDYSRDLIGLPPVGQVGLKPEPRTFTIVREWDVTQRHGAPDAHTYGMCQAAANLAACMGSRGSYTTVDGVVWHMERQEPIGPQDATWLAVDVTAVRQFDLMG